MPKRGRVIELVCPKCGKKCGNQGSMRRHMMTHDEKPESPSWLRFFKKAPPPKFYGRTEIHCAKADQASPQSDHSGQFQLSSSPIDVKSSPRPPPPNVDMVHYMSPLDLTDPNLNKKSPQFRLAHVRYFEKLKILTMK